MRLPVCAVLLSLLTTWSFICWGARCLHDAHRRMVENVLKPVLPFHSRHNVEWIFIGKEDVHLNTIAFRPFRRYRTGTVHLLNGECLRVFGMHPKQMTKPVRAHHTPEGSAQALGTQYVWGPASPIPSPVAAPNHPVGASCAQTFDDAIPNVFCLMSAAW